MPLLLNVFPLTAMMFPLADKATCFPNDSGNVLASTSSPSWVQTKAVDRNLSMSRAFILTSSWLVLSRRNVDSWKVFLEFNADRKRIKEDSFASSTIFDPETTPVASDRTNGNMDRAANDAKKKSAVMVGKGGNLFHFQASNVWILWLLKCLCVAWWAISLSSIRALPSSWPISFALLSRIALLFDTAQDVAEFLADFSDNHLHPGLVARFGRQNCERQVRSKRYLSYPILKILAFPSSLERLQGRTIPLDIRKFSI